MKDGQTNPTVAIMPLLGRVALALCLAIIFNLTCFGLLQWSEPYLSQGAVWFLTRVIWWPVVFSCGVNPGDLVCALPGMVFGFFFHWLVAFGLLWWHKRSEERAGFAALSLK
jgi:hypothetical protein